MTMQKTEIFEQMRPLIADSLVIKASDRISFWKAG